MIGVSSDGYGFVFKMGSSYKTYSKNFPDKDNWHRITKIFTLNELIIRTDYAGEYSYSGSVVSSGPIGIAGDTDLGDGYDVLDWIFVREYTSPEPTVYVLQEERRGYRVLVQDCGVPARNASVYLYTDSTKTELVANCTTDSYGICFLDIQPGTYYVSVDLGYAVKETWYVFE